MLATAAGIPGVRSRVSMWQKSTRYQRGESGSRHRPIAGRPPGVQYAVRTNGGGAVLSCTYRDFSDAGGTRLGRS
jgi:hypothetical protein